MGELLGDAVYGGMLMDPALVDGAKVGDGNGGPLPLPPPPFVRPAPW